MGVTELDPKLAQIAEDLSRRSNGTYDDNFVRDLVAHIAMEFDGVRMRDYVDVLIAKEAGDELRRLHGMTTLSS